jgi:hypothetical protein
MSFGRLSPSRGPAAPDARNHMLPQGKGSPKRNLAGMGSQRSWEFCHRGPLAQARVRQRIKTLGHGAISRQRERGCGILEI